MASSHPLVQRAIYDDLPAARRRELHGRAAELVGGAEALGHRVAATTVTDGALGYELEVAACDAAKRGRPAVAARWLAQAAELSPRVDERERRLLDAFEMLLEPGDVAGAEALEPDVTRLAPSARASGLLGRLELLRGRGAVAEQLLLEAWDNHEPRMTSIGAAAAAQLAVYYNVAGRCTEALAWSDRAVEAGTGSPGGELVGLLLGAVALVFLGRVRAGFERVAFVPESPADLQLAASDALSVRGMLRLYSDDLRAARRDLVAAYERLRAGVPCVLPASAWRTLVRPSSGWGRGTTPSFTPNWRCRSRVMPIAYGISHSFMHTQRWCPPTAVNGSWRQSTSEWHWRRASPAVWRWRWLYREQLPPWWLRRARITRACSRHRRPSVPLDGSTSTGRQGISTGGPWKWRRSPVQAV